MTLLATLDDARGYDHVVVAPHLDDAALSCGGLIAGLVAASRRVLAVTLCAGSPVAGDALSPFAEYLHREWGLGDDPIARRRAEDTAALAALGCDGLHLGELDAPYRVAAYGVGDGWRGSVAPEDPLIPRSRAILAQLRAQQPGARLYVPLGVGHHVDHQVVYAAGVALAAGGADVRWYEDAPYAAKEPAAVERRLAELGGTWQPEVVDITAVLATKLRAIEAYPSQLRELFGDAPMEQMMTDYARMVGGERYWRPFNAKTQRRRGRSVVSSQW